MSTNNYGENVRRQSTGRRVGLWFSAVFAVLAFAALAVFGDSVSLDSLANTASEPSYGTKVTVAAPAVSLVCPIPLQGSTDTATELGLNSEDAQTPTYLGSTTTALIGGVGEVSFATLPSSVSELNAQQPLKAATGSTSDVPKAIIQRDSESHLKQSELSAFTVVTTKNRSVTNAESGELTVTSILSGHSAGDTRGVAAATCGPAAGEHWLVGGSTSVGSSTKLIIQNPSITPATVTLTMWGPSGRIELGGSQTMLVGGESKVETLLEGVAAEQRRLAVHVEARGALVSAYLEHSELDGLTAQGVDYVSSTAGPSKVQVLSGVALAGEQVDSDHASFVRLLVPDFSAPVNLAEQTETDAAEVTADSVGKARVSLLGPQGKIVLFGAEDIELVAGQVHDVSLGGAPAGVYSLIVESDVPVIAGAKSLRKANGNQTSELLGDPFDFAWVNAASVYANENFESRANLSEYDLETDQISDDLVGHSTEGAVALTPGLDGEISLIGLPDISTVPDLVKSMEMIPNDYSALENPDLNAPDTGDGSGAEAGADTNDTADWTPKIEAVVTGFADDGSVVGTQQVALSYGQSIAIRLVDFPNVTALAVTNIKGGLIDWSVALSVKEVAGSNGRFAPITAVQDPSEMSVARTAQLDD